MGNPRPNILYLHSHDTGRYVQPYGQPVPTPNIQRLADQGILFRQAFCAAPTCSASRACLLTGQYGHNNGMLGLAHRGWSLNDYRQHIVHPLREAGYHSVLIGEQHIAKRPDIIGFDRVEKIETTHVDYRRAGRDRGDPRADPPQPFFLSVGFFETHRDWLEPLLACATRSTRAARQPARHARDAPRHGRLQGQRAHARPGRGLGARGARRAAGWPTTR